MFHKVYINGNRNEIGFKPKGNSTLSPGGYFVGPQKRMYTLAILIGFFAIALLLTNMEMFENTDRSVHISYGIEEDRSFSDVTAPQTLSITIDPRSAMESEEEAMTTSMALALASVIMFAAVAGSMGYVYWRNRNEGFDPEDGLMDGMVARLALGALIVLVGVSGVMFLFTESAEAEKSFTTFNTTTITGGGAAYTKSLDTTGLTDDYVFYVVTADFVGGSTPSFSNTMNMEFNNGSSTIYKPAGLANYGTRNDSNNTALTWTGMMKIAYPGGGNFTIKFQDTFSDGNGPYTATLNNVSVTIYLAPPPEKSFTSFSTTAITGGGAAYTKSLDTTGLADDYIFYTVTANFVGGSTPSFSNTMNMEFNNGGSTIYKPTGLANYGTRNDSGNTALTWTGMMKQSYPGGGNLTIKFQDTFSDGGGPYTATLNNVSVTIYLAPAPEKSFSSFNTTTITGGGAAYTKSLDTTGLTHDYLFYTVTANFVGGSTPSFSNTMNMEFNNGSSTIYKPAGLANYGTRNDSTNTALTWTGMMKQSYPGGGNFTIKFQDTFSDGGGPYSATLNNVSVTIYPVPSVSGSGDLYYMAKSSGNWSSTSIWYTNTTGGTNPATYTTAATETPTATNSAGIFVNADVVVDANISIDQTTINAEKIVMVSSGVTLDVDNGTGDDLTITGDISSNGTITTASSSTVVYNGGDQTIVELNYPALVLSGNGTKSFTGTTTATGGIQVTGNLTIDGDGASTTFIQAASSAGTASNRVVTIDQNVTVTISDVTIRYGNITGNGGGISFGGFSGGTLTIANSMICENYASVYGGGIYNLGGTLTVSNSTISENTATTGGGIYNVAAISSPILSISNSTISGNTANEKGGGFNFTNAGIATIINSTIANNHSDNDDSGAEQGGGINNDGHTITIANTILANNYRGSGTGNGDDYWYDSGTLTDNGYNVVEYSNVASNATGGFDNTTSILYNTKYNDSGTSFSAWAQGGNAVSGSLGLSSTLADNGGSTQTLALASTSFAAASATTGIPPASNWNGSPFIDGTYTDQRGVVRTAAQNTSIGAYSANFIPAYYYKSDADGGEWNGSTTWTRSFFIDGTYESTNVAPTVDNSLAVTIIDGATVTVSTAVEIDQTTVNAGSSLIIDSDGELGITDGTGTDLNVNGNLDMDGGTFVLFSGASLNYGSSSTLIYSDAAALQVTGSELVNSLNNVTFNNTNGVIVDTGTAISGTLTITSGTTLTSSESIAASGETIGTGTVNLSGGTFTYDRSGDQNIYSGTYAAQVLSGSGTKSYSGTTTVTSGVTVDASITIEGVNSTSSIIQANASPETATSRVFEIISGTVIIQNLAIKNGYPSDDSYYGGGIYLDATSLTLNSCLIDSNEDYWNGYGGGIYTNNGTLTLNNTTLSNNTAYYDGGGIYHYSGVTLTITNSTISGNTVDDGLGGGLTVGYAAQVTISGSVFDGNRSYDGPGDGGYGGAIYCETASTFTVNNSTFNNNYARYNGGALSFYGTSSIDATITNSLISNNEAEHWGGGIEHRTGTLTLENVTISGNTATSSGYAGGAGIYLDGTADLKFVTISGNTAALNGGGICTSGGTLTIQNSIMANNTAIAGSGADFYNDSGSPSTITDSGYNAIGVTDGYTWAGTGDWTDQSGSGTYSHVITGETGSLYLATTLADNGGPSLTLAIIGGSFAIDGGIADVSVTTDQRGETRADPPTIGAFEYIVIGATPNAPTSPLCEGATNPTDVANRLPEFGWTFSDPDSGDMQGAYQILVGTTSGASDMWDSGRVISSDSSDISYGGSDLDWNTEYFWQVRTWDDNDNVGSYCTAQTFTMGDYETATYDFTDATNNFAYQTHYGTNTPRIPGDGNYTAYTSTQYANVSADDGSRNTWYGNPDNFANLLYKFAIDESPDSIVRIDITWIGYDTLSEGNDFELNTWNDDTSSWDQWFSTTSSQSTDQTYTTSVTSGFSNYIDSSGFFQIGVSGSYGGICFLAGTSVLMGDGSYRNIEDIRAGDTIISFNVDTGEQEQDHVTRTFAHPVESAGDYYLVINGDLRVTPNHPIFSNGAWVRAESLAIGDLLFTENGELVAVVSIDQVFDQVPTYNLEVESNHNYFAEGFLVHNKPLSIHENYVVVEVIAPESTTPSITTSTPTGVGTTTATVGGNITSDGGAIISERGVVYSITDTDPRIGDADVTKYTNGIGAGTFSETISSLTTGTKYYVQAYAINSVGTTYGGVENFTTQSPMPGNALDLDGSDDYIQATPPFSSLSGSSTYTISAWVLPDYSTDPGDAYDIVSITDNTLTPGDGDNATDYIAFRISKSSKRLELGIDNGTPWTSAGGNTAIPEGIWSQVAVTVNGTSVTFYLNGTADGGGTISSRTLEGLDVLNIGASDYAMGTNEEHRIANFFHGLIDEVRIWNDVRSPTEIKLNMDNPLDGTEGGLVAYYNFNHSSGTSLTDNSPSGHHGTLKNMTGNEWTESYAMVVPIPDTITTIGATYFTFSWTIPQTGIIEAYLITVDDNADFVSPVSGYNDFDSGSDLTEDITGLNAGTTYYVKVRAYKSTVGAVGLWSDVESAQTLTTPSIQASDVQFSSVDHDQMDVSWTRGDGETCAVFLLEGPSGTAAPQDGTSYTANTEFGSGSQIGTSGWYCVYDGTGTSFTVTGLTSQTTYRVHVCEYTNDSTEYITDSATGNPADQLTAAAPPNPPASPLCEGVTNPTSVTDQTPEFSWTFSDDDSGDTQGAYQIIVGTTSGASDVWDSGKISSSSSTNISYGGGTTLARGSQYYWQVKTWDNSDEEGTYCSAQNFTMASIYYMAKSSGNWDSTSIWYTNTTGGTDPDDYTTVASFAPTSTNSEGIIVNDSLRL
jgi:hypothetical protein